jgi:hypothetical protein
VFSPFSPGSLRSRGRVSCHRYPAGGSGPAEPTGCRRFDEPALGFAHATPGEGRTVLAGFAARTSVDAVRLGPEVGARMRGVPTRPPVGLAARGVPAFLGEGGPT